MGEAPRNPTGFAHGFRPLEGDHPPPTPTQRDEPSPPSQGGFGLSAMSQQTPVEAHRSAVGGARKRRRLPGPLAFLEQGGSGGLFPQDGGGDSDADARKRRMSEDSNPGEGEAGGGHFWKGPWLSLCSAIDAPIAEACASDSEAMQAFLRGAVSPISEVLAGDFDLRVPIVTAVIDTYNKLSISDVVVDLVDPSGRIKGYLHPGCLEEHGPFLGPGAALLLKEVSIFVSGPGTTRLLNVHPDCVLAVFPADSPLPDPQRLEWLTTCGRPAMSGGIATMLNTPVQTLLRRRSWLTSADDPPFTPRAMPDSGDEGRTQREPSSRTPSPTCPLPTSPTSTTTRPRSELARVRPRSHAAGGRSEQYSHKDHHHQHQEEEEEEGEEDEEDEEEDEVTPRSSSPTQRSIEPSQGQQDREQQQQQRHRNRDVEGGARRRERVERLEQALSPPTAASASGDRETQDDDDRTDPSSIGPLHGKRLMPYSPPSSSPLFSELQSQSPSPSQSQSQTLQHIALGQRSDNDEDGDGTGTLSAASPAAAIGSAILSRRSSESSGRDEARDVPDLENGHSRGVSIDSASTHIKQAQARSRAGRSESARLRRGRGGSAGGFVADACGAGVTDERSDDVADGSDGAKDEGSSLEETVCEDLALRDRTATADASHTSQRRQEEAAEARNLRRVDSLPADVADPPPRCEDGAQRTPVVQGQTAATLGSDVEGGSTLDERTAWAEGAVERVRQEAVGATPSIWADLGGLGSSEDSSSGDEAVGKTSTSAPLREGFTASDGAGQRPGHTSKALPEQVQRAQEQQQRQHLEVGGNFGRGSHRVADVRESNVPQSPPYSINTPADTNMNDGCETTVSNDNHDVLLVEGFGAAPAPAVGDGLPFTGSAGFSLLEDAVGNDALLDAALDDSD